MAFFRWQSRLERHGKEPLVETALFGNHQLTGGLTAFFFQFLLQAGVFFIIPLFLSVVLGLTAVETGVRILPLSIGLLITAIGRARSAFPKASPRRVCRVGCSSSWPASCS